MRRTCILAIGIGVLALFGSAGVMRSDECRAETYADGPGHAKSRRYRKRPLEVTIYGRRRRGGYSYSVSDVINTYRRSPPPYAHVRQTPAGPFDSGFFFDSGIGQHGGDSPYQH
jgi:hypothetical protein